MVGDSVSGMARCPYDPKHANVALFAGEMCSLSLPFHHSLNRAKKYFYFSVKDQPSTLISSLFPLSLVYFISCKHLTDKVITSARQLKVDRAITDQSSYFVCFAATIVLSGQLYDNHHVALLFLVMHRIRQPWVFFFSPIINVESNINLQIK